MPLMHSIKAAPRSPALLITAGLLTLLSGCGGGGGGGSTPPPTPTTTVARFAFVANAGDDTLSAFLADNTTGALRHHGYVPTGSGPGEVVIDPSGQFVYTLNATSLDISLFQLDSLDGTLTQATCDTVNTTATCSTGGGTPVSMVFGRNGTYAYVANQVADTLTVHQLDPGTGALSDFNSVQPPQNDASGGSSHPVALRLHPDGNTLYAVHDTTSDVTAYTVDPTDGTLSPVTGSPVVSGGTGSIDLAITPNGSYVYVANATSGDIDLFTVDATGLLVPNAVAASVPATGLVPQAMAIDPTGQWLYLISRQASGSVALYSIQSDGTLSQINCGASLTCAAGNLPESVAVDPTGQFVSVTNGGDNSISLFAIDPTSGKLSALRGLTTRNTPSSVAYYSDTAEATVTPRFAYVANYNGISLSGYTINSGSGALSAIGTPTATANKPTAVTADPRGRHVYATNDITDNVSAYAVNSSTGALTQITGSPFAIETNPTGPQFGPQSITVDPSGRFAYVANVSDTLTGYSVNAATGALTLLSGSPFAAGDNPHSVAVDPTGRFLYSANLNSDDVTVFGIDHETGALTTLGSAAAGDTPSSVAVDPTGRFVYVANNGFLSFNVSAYSIDPLTGLLTEITGSPFSAGNAPISITVDPLGEFVYVANRSTNNVTPYTINQTTGALTAGTNVLAELNPQAITIDPSGQFVYVANGDSASVSGYSVDSGTGALTSNGSVATGLFPRSIVTTGVVQ